MNTIIDIEKDLSPLPHSRSGNQIQGGATEENLEVGLLKGVEGDKCLSPSESYRAGYLQGWNDCINRIMDKLKKVKDE